MNAFPQLYDLELYGGRLEALDRPKDHLSYNLCPLPTVTIIIMLGIILAVVTREFREHYRLLYRLPL